MRKKILLVLILMMIISIFSVKKSYALVDENYLTQHEVFEISSEAYINIPDGLSDFVDSMERLNFRTNLISELNYKGYYEMDMNTVNKFEIDFEVDELINFDLNNISKMYAVIEFENVGTSSGGFFNFDNSNITKISQNEYKYSISKTTYTEYGTFNIWWANVNNPSLPYNDVGNIRYVSTKLHIEYINPVESIKHVNDNYTLLPLYQNGFKRIEHVIKMDQFLNVYRFYITLHDKVYSFDVNVPLNLGVNIETLVTDKGFNISYSSDENYNKYLYIQPNFEYDPYPFNGEGTINDPSNLMVGFISINLTNRTYNIVEKLELTSIINKESNASAFMYLMLPMNIEKIINVHIKYDYRYRYFLFNGSWQTVENIYAWDDKTEINGDWWVYLNPISAIPWAIADWTNVLNINTIQPISEANIPDYVKNRYVNYLNGNLNDLSTLSHYKIHLQQFTKFGSTDYDINNSSITEITYMQDGIIYQVPYDNIKQDNDDPSVTPDDKSIWAFDDFFIFSGVNSLGSFLLHLVKYWKEAGVSLVILYIFLKFVRIFK